jgi:hypothetical protein
MSRARVLIAATLIIHSARASGQTASISRPNDRLVVGGYVGASFYAPVGAHLGQTADRQFVVAAVRAEWTLVGADGFAISTSAELIPVAVVTHNPTYRSETRLNRDDNHDLKVQTGAGAVYGFGGTPIGFELRFPAIRGVRPFVAGGSGFLIFTRDTPVPDSRRFNFTFEYGGGVEFVRKSGKRILFGYKFHHLSNAYTASENPGLDANVFYVGILRGSKLPNTR